MTLITQEDLDSVKPGPIAWMAAHPVAANLLMMVLIVGGILIFMNTTKEVFPVSEPDTVTVSMRYPGASPEEVEQGIVLALEQAVRDVDGLGEITSTASEGSARLVAEVLDVKDMMRIAQDIKSAVDRINTFPGESEDLTVAVSTRRRDVMEIALYGDVDEHMLRESAELLRDRLQSRPDIGPVELSGVRDHEIHIEVPQENLRRYSLTLTQVAEIIRTTAIELGGGSLKTDTGEILVRMTERRDNAAQFRDIPIIRNADGSRVTLGQIAHVRAGFTDTNNAATYNGKPSVQLEVFRVGDQTPISVAQAVYDEVAAARADLPAALEIGVVNDRSKLFSQRGMLLVKNGLMGLLFVVIILALFLDFRLAFWVSASILVSFIGAFLLFPMTPFTVNIISMFAFLIAIGIVVDDAIVTGENIYSHRQAGASPYVAAVNGAREIAMPILVSVMTNMVAFLPLLFIPGQMGKTFYIIPVVVVAIFIISLIECMFILPNHLLFKKVDQKKKSLLNNFMVAQRRFNAGFQKFVSDYYGPFVVKLIHFRYVTLAVFLAVLFGFGGYALSGRMGMQLFPRIESDFAFAAATLQVGAPMAQAQAVQKVMIEAAQKVIAENGGEELSTGIFGVIRGDSVEVRAFLTPPEQRPISTTAFTNIWREKVGDLPGLQTLSFQSNRGGPGSGAALTVQLNHRDRNVLNEAAQRLAASLAEFPMTKDIDDGAAQGKRQYDFRMKPLGHTLGLTTQDVARQVRAAFYGSEALKQQRSDGNEVTVLVRLPEAERRSEFSLRNMILRTPAGGEVLLRDVVEVEEGRAYTSISRRDGRRIVTVTADVEPPSQAGRIINALNAQILPELQQRYPGLTYSFEGRQAEMRDSIRSLLFGLIGVVLFIYGLLCLLFGSYAQPVMVLIAIPFSAIGAVLGHMIMGYDLSVMSLFGMMALAGVVVNGSLVLIEFANRKVRKGVSRIDAVKEASIQRFRPIFLTMLTTFIGLAPMIFETSRQARFLIPMALSLGYGIVFATTVTLLLVPTLYVIVEDVKTLISRVRNRAVRAVTT